MNEYSLFRLVVLLLGFSTTLSAQKPVLSLADVKSWHGVSQGALSNDGRYVLYNIINETPGERKLVINSLKGEWEKQFTNVTEATFYGNNLVVFKSADTLKFVTLGTDRTTYLASVSEYKFSNEKSGWIACKIMNSGEKLLLRNLYTGAEKSFYSARDFRFDDNGTRILIKVKDDVNGFESLQIINLNNNSITNIWSAQNENQNLQNFVWGKTGNQVSLTVKFRKSDRTFNEIWYYREGMKGSQPLVTNETMGAFDDFSLGSCEGFSADGEKIFFNFVPKENPPTNPSMVMVDVWSYLDPQLQSLQPKWGSPVVIYSGVFNIDSNKAFRLTSDNEHVVRRTDDFAFISKHLGSSGLNEAHWSDESNYSYYLHSLNNGKRIVLKENSINPPHDAFNMSPTGKWIIFYDIKVNDYFSYEVESGIVRNITKGIKKSWVDDSKDYPQIYLTWLPQRGTWLQDDKNVLVYDAYDVWLVDPSGQSPATCVTNKFGQKNKIKFEVSDELSTLENLSLTKRSIIWLKAYNETTKERGYYKINLGTKANPELCIMGPHVYGSWSGNGYDEGPIIKARDSNVYLQLRSSATEAPNYFVTQDFKKLRFLTKVVPHQKYNWYTTELHNWKSLYGNLLQGVLYKPENFDSTKKYPLIFDYYEIRSGELNLYRVPKASEDRIDIPLFVSNGYLVFTPDIHYKIAEPGLSAFNSVVSAANYLARFAWVDNKRMGLQGHSFGGYETNYIISHTNLFTAACSAAGLSDLISNYGSETRLGFSIYWSERNQGRMGKSIWENTQGYINNSPIFKANKVNTPLLMMHNRKDRNVPFAQGVQFFTALRRLGKKVWLLQYDVGDHSVDRGKDAEDYHTRMMQFFDHYLKDSAAPRWMIYGISTKSKGIDGGLDLIKEKDPKTGKWITPPEGGLLTDEEKKKVEALRMRKPVIITID